MIPRTPMPFQYARKWPAEYPCPAPSEFVRNDIETIVAHVEGAIETVLGRAGVRALQQFYPGLWDDLRASTRQAWQDGHFTAWLEGRVEVGNQAQAQLGRFMVAALSSAVEGDTPEQAQRRTLCALADVEYAPQEEP